jgi:hypothetical protein
VGRAAELAAVDGALRQGLGRDSAVVVLTGPAGIGKTRLADAAAARARELGFDVHWGSAWDGPGAPPLFPWAQIVRSATGHDLPDSPTQFALFDGVVQTVLGCARDRPTLVVLDDAHLAGRDALHLLELLVRQRRNHFLTVLVTNRRADAGAKGVADLLGRVEREATVLHLEGLRWEDVHTLAEAAGATLGPDRARELHEATGGNPFFVLQLAPALRATRAGHHAPVPLPANVLDVLRQQLALVDAETRRVLDAAAVQGVQFDPAVSAAVAGCDQAAVAAALDAAAELGIVAPPSRRPRFAHSLYVAALVRDLTAPARAALHLATADALADVLAGARAGERDDEVVEPIAAHLADAGDLVAPRRLLDACRAAAASARRRFAPAEAAGHLEVAVPAARDLGADGETIDVLVELCGALADARDLGAARRHALAAAELARARRDAHRLARVALSMPPDTESIEVDQLVDPAQLALREEALARLPRDDDLLAAALMSSLAISLYWAQRTGDRARDHRATAARREQLTATALELARRSGNTAAIARAIGARLYALWGPDAPADFRALVDELFALADAAGDGTLRLQALGWDVVDALRRGDLRRAAAAVAEHGRLAEARHDPVQRWTSRRWQASLAVLEGRLEDGLALAASALEFGTQVIDPAAALAFYSVQAGFVLYLQGRLGDVFDSVREMAADPGNVPAWRFGFVLAAVEAGQPDVATRELATLAAGGFEVLPRDLDWLSSLVAIVPAVHRLADARHAALLRDALAPHADEHALVGLGYASYGPVRRALALLEWTLGDLDAADAHLQRALAELDPSQVTFRALCGYERACVLAARDRSGDRATAAALLAQAMPLLDAAGLAAAAPARDLAARLGSRRHAALRDEGDHWLLVGLDGAVHPLRPLRGLALLRALVRSPAPQRALDLLWSVEPPDPDSGAALRAAVAGERGAPIVDAAARVAYRRRVAELEHELDAADRAGDTARSAAAADELARLQDELRRAHGLGARPRRETDAAERARVSVTKLLRRAVAAVRVADPVLGAHLQDSVVTGTTCAYEPAPGERVDWDG